MLNLFMSFSSAGRSVTLMQRAVLLAMTLAFRHFFGQNYSSSELVVDFVYTEAIC